MREKIIVKGYKLQSALEQIGLKTIYRAIHLTSGEEVLMVLMQTRPGPSLNRLEKRAALSQKLQHPAIVNALDYGILPESQFYYTHTIRTSTPITLSLSSLYEPSKKLFTLIDWCVQLCNALKYLHEAGTTHRDLQTSYLRIDPNNQLILEGYINSRPKTEGRSIAKMVNLPYMAPEQLKGAAIDAKSDIYSFGVVIYQLITGKLPYSSNYLKLEDAKKGALPEVKCHYMDLPEGLEKIINKCLAPKEYRFQNVDALNTSLEKLYESRSIGAKIKELSQTLGKMLGITSNT